MKFVCPECWSENFSVEIEAGERVGEPPFTFTPSDTIKAYRCYDCGHEGEGELFYDMAAMSVFPPDEAEWSR